MKISKIMLVVALVLSASVAYAATLYKLGPKSQLTEVAGKKTETFYYLGSDEGDFRAMYEITGREISDNALFAAKDRQINTLETKWYGPDDFGKMNGPKTVGFEDTESYIRGIAVCLNKAKNEVKGVKIWGARLDRDTGKLSKISSPKKWERTNCKYWGEGKYCTEGKVASRILVYYSTESGRKGTNGIGLECRAIKPKD